jgi:ribosomal protein S18 acetylase RimI-like enzyme
VGPPARVAELADAMDSKSIARKGVRVRIPPRASMIRVATLADARAIAQVHVASWRAGYRGLVPDAYLERLSVDERAAMWETILRDGETTVLVAGDGERIDGFVAFHAARGEIGALYVDPPRFRAGIGTALLSAAHERLGDKPAVALWVLDGNHAARAFYERHGYEPDGAPTIHGATGAAQVRMTRRTPE